jgi:hypothetical protein
LNIDKHTRALWIAAAGAILAWPFGELVAMVLATGQDGPGTALAHTFGGIATVATWGLSTAATLWNLRKGAKHLSKVARAAVALSIAFLPVVAVVSIANQQYYDLRVWNETGTEIDSVSVRMIGKRYSFGAMNDGVSATIGSQEDRPLGSAEIRWTGEDRRSHTVNVDLSELVPRRYDRGILTFTISAENNVRVGFFVPKEPPF